MEPKSAFKIFLTIFISAVVHTFFLFIMLGLPFPRWNIERDPETLQFGMNDYKNKPAMSSDIELIAQKQAAAVRPKPKPVKPTKFTEPVKQEVKAEPKIINVNFDKQESETTTEEVKVEKVAEKQEPVEQPAQVTLEKKKEEPKLKPVSDKLAGVQADEDDAATEAASGDANPASPEPVTEVPGQ